MENRLVERAYKTLVKCSVGLMLIWWVAIPAQAQKKSVEEDIATRARPYEQFIGMAAAKHEADPFLLYVVGWLETRFNPAAVSKRGARGMMQFMPATAARYGLGDPHNPQVSMVSHYALQSIMAAMCSSGLCAVKLSDLYKAPFHQPSLDFARLPDFT